MRGGIAIWMPVLLGFAVGLSVACLGGNVAEAQGTGDRITTRQLEVVDAEGNARITLSVSDDGLATMRMKGSTRLGGVEIEVDENGRAAVYVLGDDPALVLSSQESGWDIGIGAGATGGAYISMGSFSGLEHISLAVSRGIAQLSLDHSDDRYVTLSASQVASSVSAVNDARDGTSVCLSAVDSAATVRIENSSENGRVLLRCSDTAYVEVELNGESEVLGPDYS